MTEQLKGEPFDLEAAKNGAEILFDGEPCKFIAHIPENLPYRRVVIAYAGCVYTFTEDGRFIEGESVRLTMAPRTVKTMGYRSYYAWQLGKVGRFIVMDTDHFTPESIERDQGFIRWIDSEWKYDEVGL